MSLVGSQDQDCSSVGVGIGQWRGWGWGGQEATRTWLFIQGAQQPQQSPFARPAEVPERQQGPETERGGGWAPKAPGRVYRSGCLGALGGGHCPGRRRDGPLQRPEAGVPSCRPRAWGQWEEGRKSDRARRAYGGGGSAAGSSGP